MGFFINVSYVINGSFLMIKKMEFRQKRSNISSFKKISNALRLYLCLLAFQRMFTSFSRQSKAQDMVVLARKGQKQVKSES